MYALIIYIARGIFQPLLVPQAYLSADGRFLFPTTRTSKPFGCQQAFYHRLDRLTPVQGRMIHQILTPNILNRRSLPIPKTSGISVIPLPRLAQRMFESTVHKRQGNRLRRGRRSKDKGNDIQPLNAFPLVAFVPSVYVEPLTCSRLRRALAPVAWRSWRCVVLGG